MSGPYRCTMFTAVPLGGVTVTVDSNSAFAIKKCPDCVGSPLVTDPVTIGASAGAFTDRLANPAYWLTVNQAEGSAPEALPMNWVPPEDDPIKTCRGWTMIPLSSAN